MGLCKCPKRQVTIQFCFEHRVCVCENCMVTNHPICVVQSYLQWLQDSDYNSICEICTKSLNNDDSIRLSCYHVFHWSCLDRLSRQLPSTTAPRGYMCPSCKAPIFPQANLVSPVADVLKEKLSGVNWARAGLGLPLLSEEREVKAPSIEHVTTNNAEVQKPVNHAVVNIDQHEAHNTNQRRGGGGGVGGSNFQEIVPRDSAKAPLLFDHDDDKYKRRPASELLRTWWNLTLSGKLRGKSIYRKYCTLGLILVFGLVLLVIIASKFQTNSSEDDLNFDFLNNPNIHVQAV